MAGPQRAGPPLHAIQSQVCKCAGASPELLAGKGEGIQGGCHSLNGILQPGLTKTILAYKGHLPVAISTHNLDCN